MSRALWFLAGRVALTRVVRALCSGEGNRRRCSPAGASRPAYVSLLTRTRWGERARRRGRRVARVEMGEMGEMGAASVCSRRQTSLRCLRLSIRRRRPGRTGRRCSPEPRRDHHGHLRLQRLHHAPPGRRAAWPADGSLRRRLKDAPAPQRALHPQRLWRHRVPTRTTVLVPNFPRPAPSSRVESRNSNADCPSFIMASRRNV